MKVKIRGIEIGKGPAGGWVFSISMFYSISGIDKYGSIIDPVSFKVSPGLSGKQIWFR